MDIVLEVASEHDAARILQIQREAYVSEAERHSEPRIPPMVESCEDIQTRIARCVVLKAVANGTIIGSVTGALISTDTCLVTRLMVDPKYQHQGLGRRLMGEIEFHFPAAGRFELYTGHLSDRNIALYQRLGYEEFKREAVSPTVDLVHMRKTRPSASPDSIVAPDLAEH